MSCCGQGRRALARPRPPAPSSGNVTAPGVGPAAQPAAQPAANKGMLPALGRALARHRAARLPRGSRQS
jgi:hypothetical protein